MPAAIWETCEELLGDAGFLWTQRAERLHDHRYRLADIERGPESRLKASVDALVLLGAPAEERALLPALEGGDPELLAAAALALLHPDRPGLACEPVLARLQTVEGDGLAALTRAIQLSPRDDLAASVLGAMTGKADLVCAASLDIAAWWGVEPLLPLDRLTGGRGEPVTLAALRAARAFPRRADAAWLLELCRGPAGPVRDTALESALLFDAPSAWKLLQDIVWSEGPGWDRPALLWAIGCGERELQPLLDALGSNDRAPGAARALGFAGRRQAADALAEVLEDPAVGPIAADALSLIAGMELEEHLVQKEPLDEAEPPPLDPVPPPLPRPDALEVRRRWGEARARLPASGRLLRGRPWNPDLLRAELLGGPAHRRAALALELLLRTHGAAQVEPESWGSHQRRQLESIAGHVRHEALGDLAARAPSAPALPACRSPWPAPTPAQAPAGWSEAPVVTALGMVTPLGDSAVVSCAAGRAGVRRITALEGLVAWNQESGRAEPLAGHCIPHVTLGFTGLGRVAALAVAALRDLLACAGPLDWERSAIYLALADGSALGEGPGLEERAENLRARLPGAIHAFIPETARARVHLGFGGACGFLELLADAQASLNRREVDACVVGGAGSLVEPSMAESLAARNRLKSSQQPSKPLPGEAAAFVLVQPPRRERAAARMPQLFLGRPGIARLQRSRPASGALLAQVIETAVAHPGEPPGYVLGGLNGDDRLAYEWGTALSRARMPRAVADAPASSAAEWFGELGAATGPVSLCMAARAHARGYAPARTGLLWLADDDETRGALVIAGPEVERR